MDEMPFTWGETIVLAILIGLFIPIGYVIEYKRSAALIGTTAVVLAIGHWIA